MQGKRPEGGSRPMDKRKIKWWLIILNVLMILAALGSVGIYSKQNRLKREELEVEGFITTVESMKQVSRSYFELEYGYVQDWVHYIQQENMTEDEALDFIRKTNTQSNRFAHIVDMDTYDARSTVCQENGDSVDCYKMYKDSEDTTWQIFSSILEQMFQTGGISETGDIAILGKYMAKDTQVNVLSVGSRVRLRKEDGTQKDYLLLRLIPVDSVRKMWVFPTEYHSGEVGLITINGAYVIQSNAMRSQNFLEFIRSYNYPDDYNKIRELEQEMLQSETIRWNYKDSRGQDCFWYYTRFAPDSNLAVLGYIPESDLHVKQNDAPTILVLVSVFAALMILDGSYLVSLNRELRKKAQEAYRASQAKTQFLSSMSHDIRTPMNAVLGMTSLARKHLDDPLYAAQCLDKVALAGTHLMTLINDVLDISKVESGKSVLNPEPFQVNALLSNLESIVRPQAENKKQTFTVECTHLEYPTVVGDQLRLNQILLNLLTNSVKYTPEGGKIKLECWENPSFDGHVLLSWRISDNGMGMTEQFQKEMYDSFAREVDSRINRIQGTGLGLAIVKQMVDLMHGSIDCQSAPGSGSIFTVVVPLPIGEGSGQDAGAQTHGARGEEQLAGTRILIAEDNDLNWEIISAMLGEKGIVTARAVNGRDCVEKLTQAPAGTYDMVFMDVQMPEMNGKEAARAIRASDIPYIRNIPIAAITADAFAEDVQACAEAGMNAHIAKPIHLDRVMAVIQQFLEMNGT